MGNKYTTKELDNGQLEMMWNFLKLNPRNVCIKSDVRDLKNSLETIRQALIQKMQGREKVSQRNTLTFAI